MTFPEYEAEEHKLIMATILARLDIEMILECNQIHTRTPLGLRMLTDVCSVVASKSVHDPVYEHALVEEIGRLSSGNSTEKALAMALNEMLALAGTVDPDTIKIPSEFGIWSAAHRPGIGCIMLAEPLLTFVFGASNKPEIPAVSFYAKLQLFPLKSVFDKFTCEVGGLDAIWHAQKLISSDQNTSPSLLKKAAGIFWFGNNNVRGTDIESQLLKNGDPATVRHLLSVEANLAVAAVGGAAIAGLMASGARDSPSVRIFSAAAAIGFNCSLLAAFTNKNPTVSGFLSKIGAIGTASAVMVALGNTVDTAMFGNFNVNALVIALICLVDIVVIFK